MGELLAGITLPDIIGYFGVSFCLLAYGLLQTGKLSANAPSYSVLNGLGAAGILVSLWFDPNLPAIVMEGMWLIFSIFGLYRSFLSS